METDNKNSHFVRCVICRVISPKMNTYKGAEKLANKEGWCFDISSGWLCPTCLTTAMESTCKQKTPQLPRTKIW
jgi:hypothetical protein